MQLKNSGCWLSIIYICEMFYKYYLFMALGYFQCRYLDKVRSYLCAIIVFCELIVLYR